MLPVSLFFSSSVDCVHNYHLLTMLRMTLAVLDLIALVLHWFYAEATALHCSLEIEVTTLLPWSNYSVPLK